LGKGKLCFAFFGGPAEPVQLRLWTASPGNTLQRARGFQKAAYVHRISWYPVPPRESEFRIFQRPVQRLLEMAFSLPASQMKKRRHLRGSQNNEKVAYRDEP